MDDPLRLYPDAVEWREMDDEIVALDLRRGVYLALNRTATTLWPLIVEGTTQAVLVERLKEEFSLDDADARRDVEAFLAQLQELELLEPVA